MGGRRSEQHQMSGPPSYQIGDVVLSFHGPLLYEAKVLKHEIRSFDEEQHWYEVHYQGWASRWDEWLDEDLLLPDNQTNRKRQSRMLKDHEDSKVEREKRRQTVSSRSGGSKSKKAKLESGESEGELLHALELKKSLVEDWERVARQRKLLQLPPKVTVAGMLDDFLLQQLKKATPDRSQEKVWAELMDGLRANFDQALPQILLYRFERSQYKQLISKHPHKRPSELYGGEHFLRLAVKLPQLLLEAKLEADMLETMQGKITELLKFLQRNSHKYILGDYRSAPPEYLEAWKELTA